MDKPNTYEAFSAQWPHQALNLTPSQRQAMEGLVWENHTAPAYNHQQSRGGMGTRPRPGKTGPLSPCR